MRSRRHFASLQRRTFATCRRGLTREPHGFLVWARGAGGGTLTDVVSAPPRRAVGRSVPRRDAAEKLRGQALFAGDIVVARMTHGKVLRSPVAHARIVSIDASEAERMAGVVSS